MGSLEKIQEKFDIVQEKDAFEVADILKSLTEGCKTIVKSNLSNGFERWYNFNLSDVILFSDWANTYLEDRGYEKITKEDWKTIYERLIENFQKEIRPRQ